MSAQLIDERRPVLDPPGYDERVLFLGASGSGKSELARALLQRYPRATVLDIKGDFRAPWPATTIKRPEARWPWQWGADHIIYRPEPQYRDSQWLAWVLRKLYLQAQRDQKHAERRRVVYVDEGLYVARAGGMATTWLANHAISGRSLHLGFWLASQRPAWIPTEIRTDVHRAYIFYLKKREDRKIVAEELADGQITERELSEGDGYGFWEIRRMPGGGGRTRVTRYPALSIGEGS